MRKTGKKISVLFILLFSDMVYSNNTSVIAKVDRTTVQVGEEIAFEIEVSTSNADEPDVSALAENFRVFTRGTSSSINIINFQKTVKKIFSYVLVPAIEGTVKIPSISVKADGRIYNTQPIEITVTKEAPSSARSDSHGSDLFVEAFVDNSFPYRNEQVVFTFRFVRNQNIQIRGASLDELKFDDFWVEDFGEKKEYVNVINGIPSVVVEIKKAIFPSRAGEITIPAITLVANVLQEQPHSRRRGRGGFFEDSFFDGFLGSAGSFVRKMYSTKPIILNVKELPAGGKGLLVGDYKIIASVSADEVKQGDSLTLSIEVTGVGNIRDSDNFPINSTAEYRIYDDKPELSFRETNGKLWGTKVIKKALVPLSEGLIELPQLELTYFSPLEKRWKRSKTDEIKINVLKSDSQEKLSLITSENNESRRRGIQVIGKDILPIKTSFKPTMHFSRYYYYLSIFGIIFPGVIYFLLFFINRKNQVLSSNLKLKRKSRALKNFKRNYKIAVHEKDIEKVEICLKEFLGDVFNVNGLATTSMEFKDIFKKCNIGDDLSNKIIQTLEIFESSKYGARGLEEGNIGGYFNVINEIIILVKKRCKL